MTKLFLLSTVAVALFAFNANAATDVSNSEGKVTAKVVEPVSIQHTGTAINFGTIVKQAQDVTVATDGSRTGTNVIADSNTPTADEFTIYGPSGIAYTISDPGSVTMTSGSKSISVDTFTTDPAKATSHTLSGDQVVKVGATAHLVAATEAADDYQGSYTFTIQY